MKYSVVVAWLLLRELVRAVMSPVHLLLYLPQRRRWQREAAAVLAQPPASAADDLPETFVAAATRRGRVFVSAGETSGESHAAKVVAAVGAAGGRAEFVGFGGQHLAAHGVDVLYPLSDRAVMGLGSVLRSLPFILGAVRRFLQLLDEDPPGLVLLVDYPGLHLVLAGIARRRGIPVVHYIAPQYWAWGPWRMRRYRSSVSATLTILPFETAFFAASGIPSEYVGHPLLDQPTGTAADLPDTPYLCLLPGSRRKEIQLNLPGMLRVAAALQKLDPALEVVLPHVDTRREELIQGILREHDPIGVNFRTGPIGPVLSRARLVLAKSGTGSLEACLHGTPTVVVYKLEGAFAKFFAKRCLSVPFIASANLIAGRPVIPEFCFQPESGWEDVERAVVELWSEGPAREACLDGIAEIRRRLGEPGASQRVARWVLPFCEDATKP